MSEDSSAEGRRDCFEKVAGEPPTPRLAPPTTDTFRAELTAILNRYSRENGSNTPDFLLATYLDEQLRLFDRIVAQRERWYGRDMTPPEIVNE